MTSAYATRICPLTPAQAELLEDTASGTGTKAFHTICLVGGLGSGKTRGLALKALQLAQLNAGTRAPILFGMPTLPQLEEIVMPTILTILDEWGFIDGEDFVFEKRRKVLTVKFEEGDARIVFRPLVDDRRIVGYNLAAALVDEVEDVPTESIKQIKARLRAPSARVRQLVLGGTPESLGGQFYAEVEGSPDPDTHVVRVKTRENHFLPAGYVEGLAAAFDENERQLYLEGRFVARQGLVYSHFARDRHCRPLSSVDLDGEYVMGCDFGKGVTAWVFGVVTDDTMLHVVGEVAREQYDTLTAAREAREWWQRYFEERGFDFDPHKAAQQVTAYVDPAGQAGSISDVRILQDLGFTVRYHKQHPRIRDRVNAVQEKFSRSEIIIDDEGCPYLVRCLSGQVYDRNGYPAKGRPRDGLRGLDHAPDALGYLVEFRWPASTSGVVIGTYQ